MASGHDLKAKGSAVDHRHARTHGEAGTYQWICERSCSTSSSRCAMMCLSQWTYMHAINDELDEM
jgi:hypothetical protein